MKVIYPHFDYDRNHSRIICKTSLLTIHKFSSWTKHRILLSTRGAYGKNWDHLNSSCPKATQLWNNIKGTRSNLFENGSLIQKNNLPKSPTNEATEKISWKTKIIFRLFPARIGVICKSIFYVKNIINIINFLYYWHISMMSMEENNWSQYINFELLQQFNFESNSLLDNSFILNKNLQAINWILLICSQNFVSLLSSPVCEYIWRDKLSLRIYLFNVIPSILITLLNNVESLCSSYLVEGRVRCSYAKI